MSRAKNANKKGLPHSRNRSTDRNVKPQPKTKKASRKTQRPQSEGTCYFRNRSQKKEKAADGRR